MRRFFALAGILLSTLPSMNHATASAGVVLLNNQNLTGDLPAIFSTAEREGAWVTGFQTINSLEPPSGGQTSACFMSDGVNLYLVVKAEEKEQPLIAEETAHDGKVWRDDSIELFIRANRDESCYLQIMANTIGTVNDGAYAQSGFVRNSAWSSHATIWSAKTEGGWSMVMSVPLASLQIEPSLDHWAIQVARNRPARNGDPAQVSTWPPAPQGLQNPSTFAPLHLPPTLDLNRFGWVLTPGAASITREERSYFLTQELQVTNQTGRYRTLRITSTAPGEPPIPGSTELGLAAGKGQKVTTRIPLGSEAQISGTLEHRLSILSTANETLALNANAVDLNYAPARLVLDTPGYRASLFESQKNRAIEARLLRLDPSTPLDNVAATLNGQNDTVWRGIVTPLEDQSAGWKVTVPGVEALPDGEYQLSVSYTTPEGAGELTRTIRKLPRRKGETWINRRGMVYRDGEPQPVYGFLFGHWNDYEKDRVLPGMFFNFAGPQRVKPPFTGLGTRLSLMEQHGLLVAMDIPTASKTGFTKNRGNTPLTESEREEYRAIIRAVGDDPRVMAWYLFDEPEIHGIGPERMKEIYQIFVEHDPWRPVIILNAYTDSTRSYQYGADISNPDPYPLFLQGRGASRTLDYIGRFLDEIVTGEESYRARWVTPQAFNYLYFGRDGNRGPTALEMRTQQIISLIHGATGFTWYPEYLTWNEPGVTASLAYLSQEYKALFPFLIEASPEVLENADRLEAGLLQSGAHSILLLANPFWEKRTFSLKDARLSSTPVWKKLGAEGEVHTHNGSITFTLEPHESMILASPGFPFPEELRWNAVEEEEKRLREIKPGNLAHITKGTTARLVGASGRSPSPFILDGVTDARSTPWAGPPFEAGQGVEIEFAQAESPAQLHLFGANLLEAVVEIEQEGGEWVEKARIKSVTPEEHHKVSWTPEQTRKVRVTAHSIPSGSRSLTIREVEIYE